MPNVITQGIKQGASFRAAIVFTSEEWSQITPITEVVCETQVAGSDVRNPISVVVRPDHTSFILSADTSSWPLGNHSIDLFIMRNGFKVYIPELSYIDLPVVKHIARGT